MFERSRAGYTPVDLTLQLVMQAEHVEVAVEAARLATLVTPEQVSGTVRLTKTDTILHGLVAPELKA